MPSNFQSQERRAQLITYMGSWVRDLHCRDSNGFVWLELSRIVKLTTWLLFMWSPARDDHRWCDRSAQKNYTCSQPSMRQTCYSHHGLFCCWEFRLLHSGLIILIADLLPWHIIPYRLILLQLVGVPGRARTTLLRPSRKWHMGAAIILVPTYLLYRVIDFDIYSSSRASLWEVLQPDSAKSSDFNTSVSSIGRETHCCQGHRSLPAVEGWLLFWYK